MSGVDDAFEMGGGPAEEVFVEEIDSAIQLAREPMVNIHVSRSFKLGFFEIDPFCISSEGIRHVEYPIVLQVADPFPTTAIAIAIRMHFTDRATADFRSSASRRRGHRLFDGEKFWELVIERAGVIESMEEALRAEFAEARVDFGKFRGQALSRLELRP